MDESRRDDQDANNHEEKQQPGDRKAVEPAGAVDPPGPVEAGDDEEAGREAAGREEADRRLHRRANWAAILSAAAAIAALVFTYLTFVKGDGSDATEPVAPRLERVDLIVRNGPSSDKPPALELLVRNGGGRSVISRAQIEIMRVYPIPLCFTQGSLPVSERYGVQLPPDATPGEIVEVPLHQQVGKNRADRFVIDLGIDPKRIGDVEGPVAEALKAETADGHLPGIFVFEVAVALVHDGDPDPLRMGTALVSMPGLPLTSEYLVKAGEFKTLTETFLTYDLLGTWGPPLACWQANGETVHAALGSEATRSADLEDALTSAVVPGWSELAG